MVAIQLPDEAWEEVEDDTEALLEEWLVGPGDAVVAGQAVARVVLVKTDYEVTSPATGVIARIEVPEGDTFGRARDLAQVDEGEMVSARGAGKDLDRVAADVSAGATSEAQVATGSEIGERLPFTGLRGAIARNMQSSWRDVPQVALFLEFDTTACDRSRRSLQSRLGTEPSVSLTHQILRAAALTLRDHPRLNARVASEGIELLREIHLGLAMDVDGSLLVPVIREADRKSLPELAAEARQLADSAQASELKPAALQGATFTVSNLGPAGIDTFTPIIDPPQVAILGVGRRAERPIAREGKVVIAPTVVLSLVFDHRAVDGHPAALFLASLRERLEQPDSL